MGGADRGFHGGRGGCGRHGHRHRFYATGLTGWQRAAAEAPAGAAAAAAAQPPQSPSPQEELQSLQAQAESAAATLQRLRRRIDEIAGQASAAATDQ